MDLRKVSSSKAWAAGLAFTGLALVAGLFFARANFGQNKNPLVDQTSQLASAGPPFPITGLPTDWTSQHVVFSATDNPGVLQQIQQDPRYWLQQLRRHHGQNASASPSAAALSRPSSGNDFLDRLALISPVAVTGAQTTTAAAPNAPGQNKKAQAQGDWSYYLGVTSGATVSATMYPAKFTFNPPAAPDCTNDYVAFALNKAGAPPTGTMQPGTFSGSGQSTNSQTATINSIGFTATGTLGSQTGTFGAAFCPSNGQGVTINGISLTTNATAPTSTSGTFTSSGTKDSDTVTLTGPGGSEMYKFLNGLTGPNAVLVGDTDPHTAQNLEAAINNMPSQCGNTVLVGGSPTCFLNVPTPNDPYVSATVNISMATVTFAPRCVGLGGTSGGAGVVYSLAKACGNRCSITDFSGGGNGTQGGTNFAIAPSTTTDATNLASAINTNSGTTTTNATSSVATVTVFATNPSGTGITLASGMSGFSWAGGTTTGGAAGSDTGASFSISFNPTTEATNFTNAVNRTPAANVTAALTSGCTPTPCQSVTATSNTLGAGSTITTAKTIANFTWGTQTAGKDGQHSIVAFNNLYSGTGGICGAGAPTVRWAYIAATSGTSAITTSPVLSIDGTKVAFVESNSGGGALLHVLKWKAGQGTAAVPVVPDVVTTDGPTWTTCLGDATKSCMFNLAYAGTHLNTNSSPFPAYLQQDALYIGDDSGVLWKIAGVFNGTPALATGWTSGFTDPGGASVLTGPIFDNGSSNVFVADSAGRAWYVKDTGSTTGTCHSGSPPCIGNVGAGTTTSISGLGTVTDPPIVDSTTGKVFVFEGNGNVLQTSTTLVSANPATPVGTTSQQGHAGAFDNNYINNPFNGTSTSGFLYVCGSSGGNNNPTLFRIGFSNTGTMSTTTDGTNALALAGGNSSSGQCSPLTEIFNTGTSIDWLFLGLPALPGATLGCSTGGCVEAFNISSTFPTTATTAAEAGGTSGIVIDNVSSSGQASSLYFTTLSAATCGTAGGGNATACAVKRTQSGLN